MQNPNKYNFTRYTDRCSKCELYQEPVKLTPKQVTTRADYKCPCGNIYFVSWGNNIED